jgi:hypothetical protein
MIPSGIKNDPKTERQNRLETIDGIGFQPDRQKNALLFIFLGRRGGGAATSKSVPSGPIGPGKI